MGAFGTKFFAHEQRTLTGERPVPRCCYGQLGREDRRKDGLTNRQWPILEAEPGEVEAADGCYIAHARASRTCGQDQLLALLQRSNPYL